MLGGDLDACWCGTLAGVLDPVGSRPRGEDCAAHIPAADGARKFDGIASSGKFEAFRQDQSIARADGGAGYIDV
jgi:hypothetical protein